MDRKIQVVCSFEDARLARPTLTLPLRLNRRSTSVIRVYLRKLFDFRNIIRVYNTVTDTYTHKDTHINHIVLLFNSCYF